MSIKVMSWVWEHSKSEGNALLLLLAIADFAHDDGAGAWPSVGTLAAKTRSAARTVQANIRKLQALGELKVETGGGRKTNNYAIIMLLATPPTPAEVAPVQAPHPTPAEIAPQGCSPDHPIRPLTVNEPQTGAGETEGVSLPVSPLLSPLPEAGPISKSPAYRERIAAAAAKGAARVAGDAAAEYPPDVQVAISALARSFGLSPPRRGAQHAFWIAAARDLAEACGSFSIDEVVRALAVDELARPLEERLTISSPKSLVNLARAKVAGWQRGLLIPAGTSTVVNA